jgi:hypothetical protein
MMSSESSTDRGHAGGDSGIQPWHFYFILAMAGATWAVIASRHTSPAALLLLSAAILAAGAAAAALHQALLGFFGGPGRERPLADHVRADLERDKALVLRAIKDLEFDHSMGKVSDADMAEIGGRLRARAMSIIEALDTPAPAPVRPDRVRPLPEPGACPSCQTSNEPDARFCKHCGARLT